MAVVRSKSCEEMSRAGAPNPFWSGRAALEWELQRTRPGDLPRVGDRDLPPVPGSDVEDERGEGEPSRPRSRSRLGGDSRHESLGMVFATPASWETTGHSGSERRGKGGHTGLRTEGPMRMEEDESQKDAGEGAAARKSSSTAREVDELQRSLEEEVVRRLHEENMKLKEEVKRLQELEGQQSVKSWSEESEVAHERDELPPPPPRVSGWDEIRYTPNGTQVPPGPPPTQEECEELWKRLPKWPLDNYEIERGRQPCGAQLGMGEVRVRSSSRRFKRSLSGQGAQDGMDSRHEREHHFNEHRGGMKSRQERARLSKECGGGTSSRQGVWHQDHGTVGISGSLRADDGMVQDGHQEQGVMSAAQAKAVWLERELASLQQLLKDQCPANGFSGQYWSRPAGRWGGGTLHYGNAGGDRAGRASGDRAFEQLGRECGDRAFAQLGRECGDRAGEQLGRTGGDRAFVQLGRTGGDQVFDQLDRDRAFGQQGRAGGDQPRNSGMREEEELQDTKDNMKAVSITLPALPPHTGKESGLACGDWLVQVRQLIGDLTVGSLEWWDSLVRSVMRRYHEWLVASPLERLQLRAPSADEYNTTTARRRMDLRTSVLLMNSVPQVLREELIAGRHLESGPILYRILRSYQPGGLAEKSESLQALTGVVASKTPKDAMERLQKWRRHQLRAVELQATLPDPSILCRALGGIVSEVLGQAPQASFRVNSFRLQSRLDVLPTMDNVESYFQMLMAEMETLSLVPEGGSNPSIKALQQVASGPPQRVTTTETFAGVCRFWGSEQGCKQGKSCRYSHPPLPDSKDRCWTCSSTTHRKADCPYKSGFMDNAKSGQAASGGSGQGGKDNGKSTGAGGAQNGKAKGGKGAKSGGSSGSGGKQQQSTTDQQPAVNKVQTAEDKGKGVSVSSPRAGAGKEEQASGQEQKSGEKAEEQLAGGRGVQSVAGTGEAELMSEVTSLLKSMRLNGPRISAMAWPSRESREQRTRRRS